MMNPFKRSSAGRAGDSPSPADDVAQEIAIYEPWLRVLAELEIHQRFRSKFSSSDVVQQTLFEAWQGWHCFQGESEAQRRAWLRQILAHQLAQHGRRYGGTQKRDVAREVSLEQSLAESSARLERVLATDESSPSVRASEHEQQLLLARLLDQLPEDYREVITLRTLQDLPHSEVARRMNRSEGAVRMLWLRAIAQLQQSVQELSGQ